MINLSYNVSEVMHLSNEDYTNAGLTQTDIISAINKIPGVLFSKPSNINHNVSVNLELYASKEDVFEHIKFKLDGLLKRLKLSQK